MSALGGGLRSKLVTEAVIQFGPYAICKILNICPTELMEMFAGRAQPSEEQNEMLQKLMTPGETPDWAQRMIGGTGVSH